jgi:hypothetical protein
LKGKREKKGKVEREKLKELGELVEFEGLISRLTPLPP